MNKHRFVWHDLQTTDVEGAKRFYGEVFNWRWDASAHGGYVHIMAGDEMIGGIRPKGPNEPGPSSWLGYVAVDDVAATVAKISSANGKVYMPTTTMQDVGTFAVVADPTGGVFAPWKSARANEDVEKPGAAKPFTFCWDELMTTNPDAASKFYSTVFGWSPRTMDMGGGKMYTLLDRPGTKNERGEPIGAGGIMQSPPGVPASFWISYVLVEDTDAISNKAKRLGAQVMVPPTDIPNVGRFSCWNDPQNTAIAVIQMPR